MINKTIFNSTAFLIEYCSLKLKDCFIATYCLLKNFCAFNQRVSRRCHEALLSLYLVLATQIVTICCLVRASWKMNWLEKWNYSQKWACLWHFPFVFRFLWVFWTFVSLFCEVLWVIMSLLKNMYWVCRICFALAGVLLRRTYFLVPLSGHLTCFTCSTCARSLCYIFLKLFLVFNKDN